MTKRTARFAAAISALFITATVVVLASPILVMGFVMSATQGAEARHD